LDPFSDPFLDPFSDPFFDQILLTFLNKFCINFHGPNVESVSLTEL
jgi:hypothetical protein